MKSNGEIFNYEFKNKLLDDVKLLKIYIYIYIYKVYAYKIYEFNLSKIWKL